jgi:hypothetical protein
MLQIVQKQNPKEETRMTILTLSQDLHDLFSKMKADRLLDLLQTGYLETYLSALSNPFLTEKILRIINGEEMTSFCPELTLRSNGVTGKEWLEHFDNQVSNSAKQLLRSRWFVPTNGLTYRVSIVPGTMGDDDFHSPQNVRFGSAQVKPLSVSMEIGCLLREAINVDKYKTMGLDYGSSIMAIHTPDTHYDPDDDALDNLFLIAKYGHVDKLRAYNKQITGGSYVFAFCTEVHE